jgi:hypothetical protein
MRGASSVWTLVALAALGLFFVATVSAGSVVATPISDDPYTDAGSGHQHKTQLEPDSFAFGQTIVGVTQSGRWFSGGGSSNIVYSSSQNGGHTWTTGGLPGTTVNANPPGPWPRISDPSVAYDPQDDVWLALGLGIDGSGSGHILLVNRSTDGGVTWSNPVTAGTAPGTFWDKTWITCDTWAQSPHYGNCYIEFDDASANDHMSMVTSTDGGLTWGSVLSPSGCVPGLGGQPVVQPNGNVIVPYSNDGNAENSFRSTDGGASWTDCRLVSSVTEHPVAAGIRTFSLPSAEVSGDGTVYLAWQDCRFRTNCTSNDIVYSTTTDGLTWSTVTRIPIDPVSSTVDHYIPGIAVDKNTSGSSTHIAVAYYYYPVASCSSSTCQMTLGFTSSLDGGATWTPGYRIGGPMKVPWIARTDSGYMVGDYISTSFTGDGKAHPVFSLAKAPDSGVNGSCYPNNSGCHQRLTSVSIDVTQLPTPPVPAQREPVARGLHRHPEDAPLAPRTAN